MSIGTYLQILGLAFALCGLIVLGIWMLRRIRGIENGRFSRAIEIKAIKPLTYKSQLILVEVMGHKLLIGIGEGGPRLICELGGKTDETDRS